MHKESRSRQYLTDAEKAAIVADYHRSGLSQRDFANRHGIAATNIQRWVGQTHQAERTDGLAALVEVPNLLATGTGSGTYRLHFPKGLMLELPRRFEPGQVRLLAELVQSL